MIDHILSELESRKEKIPKFDSSAIKSLKEYLWPGNVRELKNVIERASIIFPEKIIDSKKVKENLIRVSIPDNNEEKEKLWDLTSDLSEVNESKSIEEDVSQIPHPNHYKKWFEYMDSIDLRRHLGDVEFILIESALEKNNWSVTKASESLKINRTTLIEKMKKLSIQKISDNC